jgi:outer membrane protein TolC
MKTQISNRWLRPAQGAFTFSILAALFASLVPVNAESRLSLADAQARAEAANPGLEALQLRTRAAQERVPQASALPDPRLQVSYFGESVQTRTGPQEAIYSISQTVPWLSKLSQRKRYASSEADAAGLVYAQRQLELRREVARAYTEAAYVVTAIASTQGHLELIAEMESVTEERVRGGDALNALLRVNLEMERNRDKLISLEQNLIQRRARLAALLAMDATDLPNLEALSVHASDLIEPEADLLAITLLANSPELLSLRQQIESADYRESMARLERYPDITFGLNYIQTGAPAAAMPGGGDDPWNVSIAINIPLWGAKNQGAINEARSLRRSNEAMLRERQNRLKADLTMAQTMQSDTSQRIQRYEKTLIPLAEQSLENTQTAYASGQFGVLELIDSERALLDLKLIYWRAVADLHLAQADIQALLGQTN